QAPGSADLVTIELTTVSDDGAVFHDGDEVFVHDGLDPDTEYRLHDVTFRTLGRPDGERLSTFATVNDVHFGETECGVIEGLEIGPIFTAGPGETPYPETMNDAAIEEITAIS